MKLLYALCALLYALTLTPAYAATPPKSAYPPGTVITTDPINNAAYDCDWGFDCATWSPVFHTLSADLLGRVDGYGQWGHKGDKIYFVTLYSTFDTATHASTAVLDLESRLKKQHFYKPLVQHQRDLLPSASTTYRVGGSQPITVVSALSGTHLVEAAEMHYAKTYKQSFAMGYLLQQVKAALQ